MELIPYISQASLERLTTFPGWSVKTVKCHQLTTQSQPVTLFPDSYLYANTDLGKSKCEDLLESEELTSPPPNPGLRM